MRRIVVAVTGASGAAYGLRLSRELLREGREVSLLVTRAGLEVLAEETGIDWRGTGDTERAVEEFFAGSTGSIRFFDEHDLRAPCASGSGLHDAMVVVPCSMGTLARVAAGHSGNLVERTADVMLKERRPLILVPRETPLNQIHLENMLRLSRAGAVILPAMPAFYQRPESVDDMVAFITGKILDLLGIANALFRRWDGGQR
jgi:flavin prenyltransferase